MIKKTGKLVMKKKLTIIIVLIIVVISGLFTAGKYIQSFSQEKGMNVIMLGGSNMEENGDVNSCGYIITTKNNELIIVDGGRDIDAKFVLEYINKLGNGKVDYWFITHPHGDHVGAMVKLLETEDITIKNLCYSYNSLEWYEKYDERGFEAEKKAIAELENKKIKNRLEAKKGQIINIDNLQCEIIRIANPQITDSDNGNDSSMVFKIIATDVNKSMIFLGDAFIRASEELLENPNILKSDVVQMAHHGQNGVTKEVYEAIKPEICCFNSPKWLYNNDNGNGYNSGILKSIEVRSWIEELGAKSIQAFNGDYTLEFKDDEINIIN